ncbi:UNVERIFIED_CONTAM: hypothetical protein NCL1_46331 [Trichonephila clavipes]
MLLSMSMRDVGLTTMIYERCRLDHEQKDVFPDWALWGSTRAKVMVIPFEAVSHDLCISYRHARRSGTSECSVNKFTLLLTSAIK